MLHFREKLADLVSAVIFSDEAHRVGSSRVRNFAASEIGLMSWATLVAVVCFVSLIALVFNVGRISNDKLEAQNAADSTAYSASLVQARAMNALTATNHMIGELTALYVMHHAIGGEVLDRGGRKSAPYLLQIALWGSEIGANFLHFFTPFGPPPADVYPVNSTPRGEATVYDAACLLKYKMVMAYKDHIAGSMKIFDAYSKFAKSWIPVVGPGYFAEGMRLLNEGIEKKTTARNDMEKIKREYRRLLRLEDFALRTVRMKSAIRTVLFGLRGYAVAIVNGSRLKAANAAKFIAEKNACVGEAVGRPAIENAVIGELIGTSVSLPVVQETTSNEKKSQLIRATYPWVRKWRVPVLGLFDAFLLRSRASRFYEFHSDQYALEKSEEFRKELGLKLYVLEGMDPNQRDKGRETWTEINGTAEADRLFCVLGLARQQKKPPVSHLFVLPRTNPVPVLGIAQAMLYNANPQRPSQSQLEDGGLLSYKLDKPSQPTVGWDTLNWVEGAADWKNGKAYMDVSFESYRFLTEVVGPATALLSPSDYRAETPVIELNWQAKLTPIATNRNFAGRLLLVQDAKIKTRLSNHKKVLASIIAAREAGTDLRLINH